MMYNSKLVAAIKVNGKVLRELKETVQLPFGEEYSIFLKNLNSVRVSIKISIDGKDMLDGDTLILLPHQELDLKRSLNGNNNVGNAFKFIERTEGIEKVKGIGAEDGLIQIEYQFEKVINLGHITHWPQVTTPQWPVNPLPYQQTPWPGPYTAHYEYLPNVTRRIIPNVGANGTTLCSTESTATATSASNDVGITVPGSIIEQKFQQVSNFTLEQEKHVMILKLVGVIEGQTVKKALNVKDKIQCVTCEKMNKATNLFCGECGTSLKIV